MSRKLINQLLLCWVYIAFLFVPSISLAQTGGLQVTLKNVNGANAPTSSSLGTPHFKLYTSPVREASGANPALFSNVQSGLSYWLEGYNNGTFWGEEFWISQTATVSVGTTSSITLTRNNPHVTGISFTNADTGASITLGTTPVFAGTKVRATIAVRNNTNGTLPVRVRLVLDREQDAVFDYSLVKVVDVVGNGASEVIPFDFILPGLKQGQFHYSYEVAASGVTPYVRTDSSNYAPLFYVTRSSAIYGRVECISTDPCPSSATTVSIRRDTTDAIIPDKNTWVIIHGRANSSYEEWVTDLASLVKQRTGGDQILLVDWPEAAADAGIPYMGTGEDWIKPIAKWVAEKLTGYGFASNQLNLIGHSWGANMCAEIAERMPGAKVNTIVALDPAMNGPVGYYNPNATGPDEVNFERNSSFSWAFHSSYMFGSHITPTRAHESFVISTPADAGISPSSGITAHSAAHQAFIKFLRTPSNAISAYFTLQRLLERRREEWVPNRISVVTNGGTYPDYEARISAEDDGTPLSLTYYEWNASQPRTIDSGNQTDVFDPQITIISPPGSSYSTATSQLNLSGTASDNTAVTEVTWSNSRGGGGTASGNDNWSVNGISLFSGQNIITVTARDSAANTGTDSITVTYTPPDTIAPAISITSPTTGASYTSAGSFLSIGGTASDDKGVSRVTWTNNRGGSGNATGTLNWAVSGIPLLNGQNIITVKAWDGADNLTTDTLTVSYAATNTTPPAVTITSPTTAISYTSSGGTMNLGGTASDDVQVARVTWGSDRGASGDASGTVNWTINGLALSPGQNVLTVTAWDSSNNSATDNLTVTYNAPDATAPSILINSPTSEETLTTGASSISIAGTAADDFGVTQVIWSNNRGGSGTAIGTNNWSVSGINLLSGANVISVTARDAANFTATKTLTATYAPTITYRITPATGGYGSINPAVPLDIPSGGSVVLNAVPTNGYEVDRWLDNGTAVQFGGDYFTLSEINSNHSVEVTFKVIPPLFYTVNVFGDGGSVTKVPNQPSYPAGSVVTLTPAANAGYQFIGWGTDAYGRSTPLEVTVTGNMNIIARFNVINPATTILDSTPPLTYNAAATAGTAQANIRNPGTGILEWSAVAMTPWLRIYGGRGSIPGPGGTNSIPFGWDANPTTAARTGVIRAYAPGSAGNYQEWTVNQAGADPPVTFIVTPSAGSNGTVFPDTAQQVVSGNKLTFTASPQRAYIVDQWSLNGTPAQTGGDNFTLSGVNANAGVSVSFKLSSTAVVVATMAIPQAAGTVSGGGAYEGGDDIILTATPAAGYYFDGWFGGVSGWGNPISVAAERNTTVQASFRRVPQQLELVQPRFYSSSPRVFQALLVGPPSYGLMVQSSPDLAVWNDLQTTSIGTNGFTLFTDAAPPTGDGFYRIRQLPDPANFSDDFNRANSTALGNGWSHSVAALGTGWGDEHVLNGTLLLSGQAALNPNNSGFSAIYRSFASPTGTRLEATFSDKSGWGDTRNRHDHFLGISSDGRVGSGYAVGLFRSGGAFANSTVKLYDGQSMISEIPSTVQFGNSFRVIVDFFLNGSVTVWIKDVAGNGSLFAGTFGPRTVNAGDGRVIFGTAASSGLIQPTIDDIVVRPIAVATAETPPPAMGYVPGGSFLMGDGFSEGSNSERPVHPVDVSSFFMDKFEVHRELWDAVRTWANSHGYDLGLASSEAAGHPIYNNTWTDAVKWCNARSELEGLTPCYYDTETHSSVYRSGLLSVTPTMVKWDANGYRLPTEAEWEKAARGGLASKRYPWGDTAAPFHANYWQSGDPFEGLLIGTSPVGYFDGTQTPAGPDMANGYGLYDMAGNVWEQCFDWYATDAYTEASSSVNPRGPTMPQQYRVLRGGGYTHGAEWMRVSARTDSGAPGPNGNIGFRCVRSL